jgi:hypothetical protein
MSYTVTQLVTNAWYLSGIVSREFETVSGDQITDGVNLLNAVLAVKTANSILIPYFTVYDSLTLIVGQEEYFIPNLISIQTMTFFIGTLRFPMIQKQRKDYFGPARANNIVSIPSTYHCERTLGGANIYLYVPPDNTYATEIVGKFSLSSVTLNQDLSLTLDAFYIEYLRYALAEYMCEEYQIQWQPGPAKKLMQYEEVLKDVSPRDYSMTKMSTLNNTTGIKWAYVNFPGWTP